VDVRVNADEILAAELDSLQPLPIKLCPIVSDPYQALESRERVTQRCLEVIATRSGWSPLVLTRSTLVRRDTELLRAIPGARVGFSLPTADDAVRAHFEPRGASIAERLSTLRFLSDAGVQTFAVVQPMLEGSVDELVDALVNTVTSVSIDVLRGVQGAALDFDDDRFRHTAADAWQATRAYELRERLEARGVGVWFGELPPDLSGAH
jgi:DNA repair photolyase